MRKEKNNLKKVIKYRLSYSGMKETDILYNRLILDKLEFLNDEEVSLLSDLIDENSDDKIYNILTKKISGPKKFKNLIYKILHA